MDILYEDMAWIQTGGVQTKQRTDNAGDASKLVSPVEMALCDDDEDDDACFLPAAYINCVNCLLPTALHKKMLTEMTLTKLSGRTSYCVMFL